MTNKSKAWDVVTTLFLFLLVCGMFLFAALWFIAPILSLTTDWEWAREVTALFWELGLYK